MRRAAQAAVAKAHVDLGLEDLVKIHTQHERDDLTASSRPVASRLFSNSRPIRYSIEK